MPNLRLAFRTLFKSPFIALVAILSLALGIGANSAIFSLFDQMLLSPALARGHAGGYRYYGTRVFNEEYLRQQDGNFKGYPFRIYVGDTFTGGYSDHFPVYVILVKDAARP